MIHFRNLAWAAAATGLLSATSVSAALVTTVYTGTIASGTDSSGVFGAINPNMTGLAFTATYIFDKTLGGNLGGINPGVSENAVGMGGPGIFVPGMTASLTINGVTKTLGALTFWGAATQVTLGVAHHAESKGPIGPDSVNYVLHLGANPFAAPALLEQAFEPAAIGNGYGGATFTRTNILSGIQSELASMTFNPGMSYKVGVASSVASAPEPGSWATLIAGFGLTGAAMRLARRRRIDAFIA